MNVIWTHFDINETVKYFWQYQGKHINRGLIFLLDRIKLNKTLWLELLRHAMQCDKLRNVETSLREVHSFNHK